MFQETQSRDRVVENHLVSISLSRMHAYLHLQANCNLPVSSKNKFTSCWIKIKPGESFSPEQE